jgi:hypothetical protein
MNQTARPPMIAGVVARSLLLPLILVVLALSGCTTAAPETPPTATPTEETTPTPADDDEATPTDEATSTPADDDDEATPTDEATATPADDDEATPTDEAAVTDDTEPTETVTATLEADTTGEQRNEAGGFAFTVPEGWQVVTNEGIPGIMGIAAMSPEDANLENLDNPDELILITSGSEEMVGSTLETDTPIEEMTLEELLLANFPDTDEVDVTDIEDIEIDGNEAIQANVSGEDPDLGDTRGSIVIARIGEDRLLQVFGAAAADEWERDAFQTVLDSLSFFAPAEPEDTSTEQPALPEGVPTPEGLPTPVAPTPDTGGEIPDDGEATSDAESIFPIPPEAENITDLTTDPATPQINFQTSLSIEEVMDFYREELGSVGAVERDVVTVISDDTFSMVFDGWPAADGLAVVVQGTVLGPDELNINVRVEEV